MEIFDIYDENRKFTGRTAERGTKLSSGEYRMVVHICLFGSDGRMLIQQRQPFKHGWSNMWDITVGGSTVSGDTSRGGAVRELSEELGISVSPEELRLAFSVTDINSNVFDDYYMIINDVDADGLKLQQEEVQAVKWADRDEIFALIDGGKFIPYCKQLIELMFYSRDHGSMRTRKDDTKQA